MSLFVPVSAGRILLGTGTVLLLGLATTFTAYLRASRADMHALSTLPPGRFLMPGDLEGTPALTFAPLPAPSGPVRTSTSVRPPPRPNAPPCP